MTKTYEVEGLEYTASNHRLRFDPDLHDRHGEKWTDEELAYLCSSWEGMKKADIAAALGRTHGTVLSKAYALRRRGLFDRYAQLGREGHL